MKRINSIDITRGVVMIIMALDHVRDLMHIGAGGQSPTDLTTTTPGLFFSRWITYLCAPAFVFLAGTSVYLSYKNKGDLRNARNFLLKRGLWLLVLELTIVNFGLFFDPGFHTILFEVIAAIGFGFIVLSLMLRLPSKMIGLFGLAILFSHDLFDFVKPAQGSIDATVLSPLFTLAAFPLPVNHVLVVAYPPIPWLGVLLTGYAAGDLFLLPRVQRRSVFLRIGLSAIVLFVFLRFLNVYGDPAAWTVQKTSLYSFLSFMNTSKYPPSLLFCLVTLGIMFLILTVAESAGNAITRIAQVYGKVPLFYFVVHFYLIHILLIVLLLLQGFYWADLHFATGTFGRPTGFKSGITLGPVYLVWIGVVAILYWPCRTYGRYKSTHNYWWLRYL